MKIYKRAILFIVIFFAAVLALQYCLDALYNHRVHQKFARLFKHQIDNEIMVFGSSVAYHHFDPQIITAKTNMASYNMGWDGIFFIQYDALIKKYLSYEKNCKYLVIACDFHNFDKNELISRPDLFYAYLNDQGIYEALHEIEPNKILLAKYLPGYKITLLSKAFYTDILFTNADADKNNGFDPAYTDSFQVKNDKPFYATYNVKQFNELKNLVEAITRKGIKVILVMTPIYEEGYKLILNADSLKDKYKSLAGKNVSFIDYTKDTICVHRKYFYNYSHLNSKGATLLSTTFSTDLLKIIDTSSR